MKNAKIENCVNYGRIEESRKTDQSYAHFGGIAGYVEGEKVLKCKNYGKVTINCSNIKNDLFGIGGVIGAATKCEIINCSNSEEVSTVLGLAGGILGYTDSENLKTTISGCYNVGSVTGNDVNGGFSGGIIAGGPWVIIENCYNKGSVSGDYAGGITTWLR